MSHRKMFGIIALIAAVAVPAWALQEVSEEDYDAAMKSINATQRGVNRHLEAQNAPDVGADGTKLVGAFEKVSAFWNARNEALATELATEALQASRRFQLAGAAGDFDEASRAFTELRTTCQRCHRQYRERTESGYRIKQGS